MLRSHIQMEKKIGEKIAYGSLFIGMDEESLRLYESIVLMEKAKTGHGRKPIPSDPFAFSLSLLVNSVTLIKEFENCPFLHINSFK